VALPRTLMFNPIFEFCFSILICVILFSNIIDPTLMVAPNSEMAHFPLALLGKSAPSLNWFAPVSPIIFFFLFISCYNFFVQIKCPWIFPWPFCSCPDILS